MKITTDKSIQLIRLKSKVKNLKRLLYFLMGLIVNFFFIIVKNLFKIILYLVKKN